MEKQTKRVLDRTEAKLHFIYGEKISQKKNRALKFMGEAPKAKLITYSLFSQVIGMSIGGTVGGMIGSIGGPKGAAVGVKSGVGVGFIAGTARAGYQTRKEYKSWMKQYSRDEILSEFLDLFENHPNLNEFKCPITKELMHYPFVDPSGFSYEKKAIESWVKEHKKSPVSNCSLKISDLRANYFLMGKQAKTYRNLLATATSGIYLSPIQIRGIGCLLKDLDEQIKVCFAAENSVLMDLFQAGAISLKTCVKQLTLLAEYLDGEPYE